MSALLKIAQYFFTTGIKLVSSISIISLAALYIFQRKLVYPSSLNNARTLVDKPDKYNLPYEEITIVTDDNEKLQSYLLTHDSTDPNYANKTILILSPNAGNIGYFLPILHYIYQNLKYNVFIYSYRGYGSSTGSPSEYGLKKDADAVMRYISTNKQLSQSSIILYGRSLGGAVSIYIAAKYGHLISGIILENTFLSIPKVVPYIFPLLSPFSFICSEIWNSEEDVKKINPDIPCLFLSGTEDEIVPPKHMKVLYDTISESSDKDRTGVKIWRDFKANHNNTIVSPGYWDTWEQFAKELVVPIGK
ncbi:hypothetical protein C6P40_003159 [Pichia californica]|uniref:AB hydrolase-1 domain-containing protein n=1 Tax=Pichia californica TaxID=460514 RepID=A0A9P6WNS4_9ASCO|nr:hypothetical protein C6P40_003159 [[Candida] californica]